MKICSLYGAGFYYIPGTDTCIKVGGFVRAEWTSRAGGSFTPVVNDVFDRTANDTTVRSRMAITLDVRNQTEYGTLRSYIQTGWNATDGDQATGSLYVNRGFIQIAGFTFGLSSSFFDNFSFAAYSNQTNYIGSDVGGAGTNVAGYTAQLGNGLSASIAIEDQVTRRRIISGADAYGGRHLPNLTANLRVDQAWGSAQVMGAINEVYPGQLTAATHHSNEIGYALGAGVTVKLPMLGVGDNIGAQFVYAKGASGYNIRTTFSIQQGGELATGVVSDAVCGTIAQGCELTETWSVVAGYQHGWNSKWKTSLYGGYVATDYSDAAETIFGSAAGTSSDWSFYQIGSRTIWTPVANLDLSVDVMYNHLDGASSATAPAGGSLADQDIWAAIFRVQRNFWP